MSEYLPFLIALLIFPIAFATNPVPPRHQAWGLLGFSLLFVALAFFSAGNRAPFFLFALFAAGMALKRSGWLGAGGRR